MTPPANNLLMAAAKKRAPGAPTSWVDPWAINGDTTGLLSDLTLTGADETNTDNGTLYWNAFPQGLTRRVDVYKDAAKTQRVCDGIVAMFGGTLNLNEDNSSGLSGSIQHTGATTTDTDSGNSFVGTPA